jgi:hypothetical protein
MSRPVGHLETQADLILQQAVDTLTARWGQTKLAADSGIGPIGPDQTDRHKILKVVMRRAIAMNQRGSIGRSSRATNITAGTVAL